MAERSLPRQIAVVSVCAAVIAAADQATKRAFMDGAVFHVAPGDGTVAAAMIAAVAAVAVWAALSRSLGRSSPVIVGVGLGVLAGGGIGNMIDLFARGAVTDWLPIGPARANVADVAVLAGAVLAIAGAAWRVTAGRTRRLRLAAMLLAVAGPLAGIAVNAVTRARVEPHAPARAAAVAFCLKHPPRLVAVGASAGEPQPGSGGRSEGALVGEPSSEGRVAGWRAQQRFACLRLAPDERRWVAGVSVRQRSGYPGRPESRLAAFVAYDGMTSSDAVWLAASDERGALVAIDLWGGMLPDERLDGTRPVAWRAWVRPANFVR